MTGDRVAASRDWVRDLRDALAYPLTSDVRLLSAAVVMVVTYIVLVLSSFPQFAVQVLANDPTDAAFAGAFVYQRSLAEEPMGDRFAAGRIVGGFLAFGCPICNAVLLALFGSSALMTYFDPLRPLLGAVSVVAFVGLLYYQRRQCEVC